MQNRILIAEDHEISRLALKLCLSETGSLQVVGEAKDGLEVVSQYEQLRPDVVLMDIKMPRLDGIDATQRIKEKHPSSRIVMITSIESDQRMLDALRVGADGFCFKEVSADQLIKVVNNVVAGGIWLDPVVSRRILGSADQASPENPYFPGSPLKIELSEQEQELLGLQSEGLDNQEIAERMSVERDEVVASIRQIIAKLLSKQSP